MWLKISSHPKRAPKEIIKHELKKKKIYRRKITKKT